MPCSKERERRWTVAGLSAMRPRSPTHKHDPYSLVEEIVHELGHRSEGGSWNSALIISASR